MHTKADPQSPSLSQKRRAHGFSIIEIALALGIVGFAFVGLMGLLPAGLSTFRTAINQTNEGRIMESLTSQTQATEFNDVAKQFDFQSSNAVFYFDEEATFIKQGTTRYGSLNATEQLAALYSVKVFVNDGWNGNPGSENSKTAVVLMVSAGSGGYAQFEKDINVAKDVETLIGQAKLHPDIRVRTMIVPKMDGIK